MKGLTEVTAKTLNDISGFNLLKEYIFIGGSAIAAQIEHRLSEDLDFCKWKVHAHDKPTVNSTEIEVDLMQFGIKSKNIYEFNHVDYVLENGVKISFYANQLYKSPVTKTVNIIGNVFAPSIETLGVMKLELMIRRASFRDYYDIYSILNEGTSIEQMVYGACKYSNNTLKSKDILAFISNGENYTKEIGFERLIPRYQVNEKDIEKYIKSLIETEFHKTSGK
jgi:predicted nucleotidyltransferase component of viral defense system